MDVPKGGTSPKLGLMGQLRNIMQDRKKSAPGIMTNPEESGSVSRSPHLSPSGSSDNSPSNTLPKPKPRSKPVSPQKSPHISPNQTLEKPQNGRPLKEAPEISVYEITQALEKTEQKEYTPLTPDKVQTERGVFQMPKLKPVPGPPQLNGVTHELSLTSEGSAPPIPKRSPISSPRSSPRISRRSAYKKGNIPPPPNRPPPKLKEFKPLPPEPGTLHVLNRK